MKQNNAIIYLKFIKPMDPRDLESAIRKLIEEGKISPVYTLLVGVDHKNLVYDGQRKYKDGKPIMDNPHGHRHLNKWEKEVIAEGGRLDRAR